VSSGVTVAVVGATGAVCETTLKLLEQRRFPVTLHAFASERSVGRTVLFGGEAMPVEKLGPGSFKGIEMAFFSAGAAQAMAYRSPSACWALAWVGRRNMVSVLFLLITPLLFSSCTQAKRVELDAPAGWKKIEAGKFFTFRIPESMQLVSEATCMECLWGSAYSDSRIRLDVEFTSWNEEYASEHLAKQADYTKQMETIDGHSAKIQS
jgi:Semialdehyde dehydrogenase, NAD binding domain